MAKSGLESTGAVVNRELRKVLDAEGAAEAKHLSGENVVAVGLPRGNRVKISGTVGDFFGSMNEGAELVLNGEGGRYLGDSMSDGIIKVNGNAGHGLCSYLRGGTVIVKGNCLGDACAMMRGGLVLIDGTVRGDLGSFLQGGTVVVTADVKGLVGHQMQGGSILMLGEPAGVGEGVRAFSLTSKEKELLQQLYKEHRFRRVLDLFATLSETGFRRYGRV